MSINYGIDISWFGFVWDHTFLKDINPLFQGTILPYQVFYQIIHFLEIKRLQLGDPLY